MTPSVAEASRNAGADPGGDPLSAPMAGAAGTLRLVLPVILLLAVTVLAVAGVLLLSARSQDRAAAEQTIVMVQAALDKAQLSATVRDYAGWDAAVTSLALTVDRTWARDNLARYLANNFGVDQVMVLADDGRVTYAEHQGEAVAADQLPTASADMLGLAALARTAPPGLPRAVTGFVVEHGQIHMAAVADIRWQDEDRPRPDPGAVLVMLRHLDDALAAEITAPLRLNGLSLLPADATPEGGVLLPLVTPSGAVGGLLRWDAPNPAGSFLDSVRWFLLVIIAALVGLTALFLSRAQRISTQQAEMLLALRRSEERYRRLVDTMPDMLALLRDGRILLLNDSAVCLLGVSAAGDLLDRPLADLVPAEDRPAWTRLLQDGPARPEHGRRQPLHFQRSDGTLVPVDVTVLALDDAPGLVMLVARDCRERAAAEQRLMLAQAQAALADRAKGQFLANISHELRTPLNAIIGFSEILRDELLGSMGNDQYRDYAVDIHEGGLHLLRLVNDLLDLARIDAGELELRDAWIDVRSLADRCLRLVAQKAAERDVALRITVEPSGQRILADEVRMKQILVNLLGNAIRFSEPGDTIDLTTGTDAEGNFILQVIDHGLGMTPEAVLVALTPFAQVEGGHNRRQPGAGLGLPLARGYAEAHGGSLSIASKPGVGTCVTVTLPRTRLYRPVRQPAC